MLVQIFWRRTGGRSTIEVGRWVVLVRKRQRIYGPREEKKTNITIWWTISLMTRCVLDVFLLQMSAGRQDGKLALGGRCRFDIFHVNHDHHAIL